MKKEDKVFFIGCIFLVIPPMISAILFAIGHVDSFVISISFMVSGLALIYISFYFLKKAIEL